MRYIPNVEKYNLITMRTGKLDCISQLADLQSCRWGCFLLYLKRSARLCVWAHQTKLLSFSREWSRQLRVSGCLDGGFRFTFSVRALKSHSFESFPLLSMTIADGKHSQNINSFLSFFFNFSRSLSLFVLYVCVCMRCYLIL